MKKPLNEVLQQASLGQAYIEPDGYTTKFHIVSDADSRAVTQWRKDNPTLSQDSFGGSSIASCHSRYNGSGDEHGPHKLVSDEEVAANAALIAHWINVGPKLVAALEIADGCLKHAYGKSSIHVEEALELAKEVEVPE